TGGGTSVAKGSVAQQDNGLDLIYLDGSEVDHAHLLITDEAGHRLGYVGDQFVNEIPGAQAQFTKASQNWTESIEPDYYVPDGNKYAITVDATGVEETDETEVGIVG